METYFDTPLRNEPDILKEKIDTINRSSLMEIFLNSISGLLAVVDEYRQLISINKKYLEVLGIDNAEEILGLRQGEIINCIYAQEVPCGCGTTQFCRTCGAAIAMATSLAENKPVEKYCAIKTEKDGEIVDLYLELKCEPIIIEETRFMLLFLRDMTKDQQRLILERSFLHDLKNMIAGLSMANYQLSQGRCNKEVIKAVDSSTRSLIKEVELQSCLINNNMNYYKELIHPVGVESLFTDLDSIYRHHPARKNRSLIFQRGEGKSSINTDGAVLLRIIANMITNALEASDETGIVNVLWEKEDQSMKFTVHNDTFITEDNQLRVFQRNFTTKKEQGRGIGTYTMKLFGEEILGGTVGFTSQRDEGTDFYISLPI